MDRFEPAARVYPPKPRHVYFFATCLVDQFTPQAGLDAIRLLEREGIEVHFPLEQTCCGQPAYTSGFPEQARLVARLQLELFPEPWPVVVPSGSCAAMIRHHYPKLFVADPTRARQAQELGERVFELTEFLVHVLHFSRPDQGDPCTIAVHTSCHARREMGVHATITALLERLSGIKIREQAAAEECCGFGGTFSVRYPDISTAMVRDKVASLRAAEVERVVSADAGCLLNIGGHAAHDALQGNAAELITEHVASFLWRRTGGAPEA